MSVKSGEDPSLYVQLPDAGEKDYVTALKCHSRFDWNAIVTYNPQIKNNIRK
jgi:hypothetical protein